MKQYAWIGQMFNGEEYLSVTILIIASSKKASRRALARYGIERVTFGGIKP